MKIHSSSRYFNDLCGDRTGRESHLPELTYAERRLVRLYGLDASTARAIARLAGFDGGAHA